MHNDTMMLYNNIMSEDECIVCRRIYRGPETEPWGMPQEPAGLLDVNRQEQIFPKLCIVIVSLSVTHLCSKGWLQNEWQKAKL